MQAIGQYQIDNNNLTTKVADLSDQVYVDRITKYIRPHRNEILQLDKALRELIGKKSHFARFVELKTENINLQV